MKVASEEDACTATKMLVQTSNDKQSVQIALLDIMLPDTDGLTLSKQIRND